MPAAAVYADSTSSLRRPELLAPAGDWECAKAAVESGADAIYFGLERFNARMRAHNFTEADLPKLMEFLHRRGVKGYVTFNTLVFANELTEAEEYIRTMIAAGVDAAIVQDIGVCRLIRKLSPDFPIHASTQMTITSAGGVEFARELGCNLVVLARECSLKEIEKIQSTQSAASSPEPDQSRITNHDSRFTHSSAALPLEVFVHGALCVAYSGQCLTSEALGGRSANRGECAQACRMPYELVSDGRVVPLGDRRYLLSPQDLAGLEVLPDLIRSGVASLKIEGRLKSPEYVANITRVYRKALDQLGREAASCDGTGARQSRVQRIGLEARYDVEMAFSRGLFTGWFRGINNQELVHARFGKKRGVFLGTIRGVKDEKVAVQLEAPLKAGDGVVFDRGHPDEAEEGGRVFEVQQSGANTWLSFGHGHVDFRRVQIGDKLWKTSDPELDRRLRATFSGDQPHFQRPVIFDLHGSIGLPLTVVARDELGHIVQVASAMPLTKAEKQPLTTERLVEQFGRMGGTPFKLGALNNHLEGEVILPMKEMNRLRRQVIAELETQRTKPKRWTLRTVAQTFLSAGSGDFLVPGVEKGVQAGSTTSAETAKSASQRPAANLTVLVRNLDQLKTALQRRTQTIYCEFEDPKKYRLAVAQFREWPKPGDDRNASIFVAPPRIFKMGEEWMLKQVRSCEADGYLVRNYDHLRFFAGERLVGDFSLNVANPLTADYFRNRFGLERLTASYDLNFVQLEALLRSAPPEWFEITIHQHMPMFHMEHCVFCAFLSKGTDYTNCGRPCDKHQVQLRDRVGAEHPLKADIGCRNTVFNARAQTGAEYVERFLDLGVRAFRIEFLNENADEVTRTIDQYVGLLEGQISGNQLWRELKLINQLGVTRGQMG
ncbi:MAG: U32 family peptidase [Verrucomicrobia bacterium]|nr:U32 family peptidase [Verrucomicrobiota bacterium]